MCLIHLFRNVFYFSAYSHLGRFEGREKEKVLERYLENNEDMKDAYEELLEKARKFETIEYLSEERILHAVKHASDILNAIEDHLDNLRAGQRIQMMMVILVEPRSTVIIT